MKSWEVGSPQDLAAVLPEFWLVVTGAVLLLLDTLTHRLRRLYPWLATLGVLGAAVALASVTSRGSWGGTLDGSPLTLGIVEIGYLATLLAIWAAPAQLTWARLEGAEFYALILWATAGISMMIRGKELLLLFVALEVLSVALYGLAAFDRRQDRSLEGGLKYFLMGAFVSSFLLYGIALTYGETGSTSLAGIGEALVTGQGSIGLLLIGVLLIFVAFGFKLGWVPFHAWAPDVYQGAPAASVPYLAVAPKVAAAAVLVRWAEITVQSPISENASSLLWILAVASMVVGTLFALVQRDLKRMLAYSGIAHMGYLAIPLVSASGETWQPVVVYLAAYVLSNFAAFALVGALVPEGSEGAPISALAGRASRQPWLAASLAIAMLSLAGIPPTLGFLGKYLVFLDAIRNHHLGLAFVGVLTSLIGAAFYLRVIYFLYMKPELEEPRSPLASWEAYLAVSIAVVLVLLLGICPQPLFNWLAGILGSS